MLVIIALAPRDLMRLELGAPLEAPYDPHTHLRWVLASYEVRREEQWRLDPMDGAAILVSLLKETGTDAERQLPIIRALGWYGVAEGSKAAAIFLRHPEDRLRAAAITALGQMGRYDSIPLLLPFLNSPNRTLRAAAISALGKFGKDSVLAELDRSAGADPDLQRRAAQAKRRSASMTTPDALTSLMIEVTIDSDDYEDLAPWTYLGWKRITLFLADRSQPQILRERAAYLLGLGQGRKATRALATILSDPTEPVTLRVQCARSVGRLRVMRAVDALVGVLDHPARELKEAAIIALGEIGEPRAFRPLLRQWDRADAELRLHLRLALRRLCRPAEDTWDRWLLGYQNVETAQAFAISDDVVLLPDAPVEWMHTQMTAPAEPARRDAAFFFAVFGGAAEIPPLVHMAANDPVVSNRWIAAAAHRKIQPRAVQAS